MEIYLELLEIVSREDYDVLQFVASHPMLGYYLPNDPLPQVVRIDLPLNTFRTTSPTCRVQARSRCHRFCALAKSLE